jgi:hypothetical protein
VAARSTDAATVSKHPAGSLRSTRLPVTALLGVLAAGLSACTVVSVAGSVAGAAVSVAATVVTTGVKVASKVVEAGVDAVTGPSSTPPSTPSSALSATAPVSPTTGSRAVLVAPAAVVIGTSAAASAPVSDEPNPARQP